ncbi:MAG: aspartate aminotransferase family protein, partial [Bryobacteraceae bacterium]|nr:aspartate aminotransferase family protein [Bryobacteraceae bacterium]
GVTVQRVGSMFTFFFTDRPVRSWEDAATCNTERYAAFFHHLLERGVYFPPSQFEAAFVSAAHDADAIEETVQAIRSFSC